MDLNTRQLRAFLGVADVGSFSKAAQNMKVAQPALSQAVRDLEEKLSLRLFDRTTRRVELTEGGRDFRRAAQAILDDLEQACADAARSSAGRRGRIVVAAPPLLASAVLPRAIAEFCSDHPDVQLTLVDCATDEIVERVRSGRADCGIGTFPASAQGVTRTRLARDALAAFFAADVAPRRKTMKWDDLRESRLITLTRESGIRVLVERGFEAAGIPCVPAYEVAQVTTAVSLVEARLGIAVLPAYARAVRTSHHIVERALIAPVLTRDVDLIRAEDKLPSPAALAFAAVLRRHVRGIDDAQSPARMRD